MARLEFFFDVVSPYSYLASTQLDALAARTGAEVVWRPFFLGGVMKAVGNVPPASLPARAPYLFRDLMRWGRLYGVPISLPPVFPTLTLTAQRALVAMPASEIPAAAGRLFRAYWGSGRNIGDPAVLADLLPAEALAAAATPEAKAALVAASEEAVRRGAFGAPTMFVRDEMFFGNDRMHFVEEALLVP